MNSPLLAVSEQRHPGFVRIPEHSASNFSSALELHYESAMRVQSHIELKCLCPCPWLPTSIDMGL